MKILKNECLNKKLILALLVVMFLCIIFPNVSHAGTESSIGGKLLQPVCDLLLALGDGVMNVIQKAIVGAGGDIAIDLTGKTGVIATILGIVAAVVVIVAITIATAGVGAWIAGLGGFLGTVLGSVASAGITTFILSAATLAVAGVVGTTVANAFAGNNLPDVTMLPTFCVGPEEIFEGKLLVFDINFFSPKQIYVEFEDGTSGVKIQNYERYMISHKDAKVKRYYYEDPNGKDGKTTTSKQNTALQLSTTISKWYYAIRNIALIFMMLILLYIGIRMMLCSIASEKSKYQKMLGDWVVSMCLVFVLHYIMVFLVNINENIIDVIKTATEKNQSVYIIKFDDDMDEDRKKSFMKSLYEKTEGEFNENYVDESGNSFMKSEDDPTKDSNIKKAKGIIWVTNLVGRIRISAQNQDGTTEYLGYAIAYIVLVIYTVFFAFTYLKRVLYMAFLTIIAPLVAMTYSIDKITDGKAQAFNMWLKEYIFNLLIQPMHLLLYLIMISMAYDLAATNIIYTLVAIGFMIPAEKFVRKMFGFEKAQTPGLLGGAAGAALTMSGMQKLAHMAGHGPGPKGGNKPVGNLDKSKDQNIPTSGKGMDYLADKIDNNSTDKAEDENVEKEDLEEYDIDEAEQNANPMDYLNDEDRKNYDVVKARSENGNLQFSELSEANKKRRELEEKANQAKKDSFDKERTKRRLLEESKRKEEEQQQNVIPKTRFDRIKNGAKSFGKYVSDSPVGTVTKWTARNVAQNKDAIATTIKGGTRLLGSVAGASIGAAAGIASGDISKVGQNIAIGATAGNSIATGINNSVGKEFSKFKAAKEQAEMNKYGENYSDHLKEKQESEFIQDKEARRFFANERSKELVDANGNKLKGKARKEKIDEFMRQASKYREEAGVTDNKIIAKAMKLDRSNPTSYESMTAALMASKAKDIKGLEPYQKRIAKKLGDEKASQITNNAAKLAGFYK